MSAQDEQPDQGVTPGTEKPEPDEETVEKVKEMLEYREDRPTTVLPGSGGTVSGTVVSDWLDDEGNPRGDGQPDNE